MTCTTHHYACDCREAKFAALEAENARLRDALAFYAHPEIYKQCMTITKVDHEKGAVTFGNFEVGSTVTGKYDEGQIAREALNQTTNVSKN